MALTSAKNTATATVLLTRRLTAGDENAFRELHDAYFARLYRFLLVICHGREPEAQDALQETFARIVRYAKVIEDEEVLWGWLKALARSAARDGNRKQRRYLAALEKFTLRLELEPVPPMADGDGMFGELLEESLAELSLYDRRLIEGKYIAGETVRELAAYAALTEKAMESRLSRLRRIARANVAEIEKFMKRDSKEEFVNALLAGEELEDFRQASLRHGLALVKRRGQRRRQGRLVVTAFVLIGAIVIWTKRPANPGAVPSKIVLTQPANKPVAGVRLINDEQLLALFPNRPLAIIGNPGHRKLVFLDTPPTGEP